MPDTFTFDEAKPSDTFSFSEASDGEGPFESGIDPSSLKVSGGTFNAPQFDDRGKVIGADKILSPDSLGHPGRIEMPESDMVQPPSFATGQMGIATPLVSPELYRDPKNLEQSLHNVVVKTAAGATAPITMIGGAGLISKPLQVPVLAAFTATGAKQSIEGIRDLFKGDLTVPQVAEKVGDIGVGLAMTALPGMGLARELLPRSSAAVRANIKSPRVERTQSNERQSENQTDTKQGDKPPPDAGLLNQDPRLAGPGSPAASELSQDPGNPDIYGIAERVRAERAKAGQVAEVPPGEGVSAPDAVEHGRQLLTADPLAGEKAMAAFESDPKKAVSFDSMTAARAHGERLAKEASDTEIKNGTDSDEYRAAWKKLSDWDTRSKAMQTEWHKTGQAQQGETDIDTGSFTGLQREYKKQTGEDIPAGKVPKVKRIAKEVTDAGQAVHQAKEKLFQNTAPTEPLSKAEKGAYDAANKVVRNWAVKRAEMENKARLEAIKLKDDLAAIQKKAADAGLKAADAISKKAAIDAAKKETAERVKRAALEKKQAEEERRSEQKKFLEASRRIRKAATQQVELANKERIARADLPSYVWTKAREYIKDGVDSFDDIRHKLATDLGLPVKQVTEALGKDKKAKYLTDDLWRKQQNLRRVDQAAKRWLRESQLPLYRRALESVPKILFSAKVGFHGTVALGTHAPMVAFQPRFWSTYVSNFAKMYRMVLSKAYQEMQVQDLLRKPNYTIARRAGLVNDPFQYEDYNSPEIMKYFGKYITGPGNRGYSVLKMLRQDMFDQHWNRLPKTARIGEVAEAIADGINHATGVVKVSAPKGTAVALFAPRLEMSRVAWLAADPAKAVATALNWKNATDGERAFAMNQLKEKAWVAGTMFGMLAINQGVLSAVGSKQKINFSDPFHSDWMKFKAAGMNLSYGNAMISMARLPVRLYKIRSSDGGKLKNVIYPDENTYSVLGEYTRSQLSPFASLATTLWLKGDWQNRPLPNSTRPVPKRLSAQGVKPYTWPEFWTEQVLPIPFEEGAREVWQHGLGMSPEQIKQMRKAMATIAIMSATGARLTDDVPYKK